MAQQRESYIPGAVPLHFSACPSQKGSISQNMGHSALCSSDTPENLREILQQFATNSTPLQDRCDILRQQHNYDIKVENKVEKSQSTMHALDPAGPARHFPSKRPPKVRSTLTDSAVYYEVHLDGHEKLNFKVLRMGRASINMYGGRCHGSGYIVDMAVMPNTRCPFTIGHLYLDLVESTGAQFLPDVSSTEVPACVALKSSDNIPIEALWSYFLKYMGHNLKAAILLGKTENYINVANEVHIDLFHWLWSRIVQNAVNHFVQYWNTHKTRKQSNNYLPSGVVPQTVFQHPETFGLRHAGIPVDLTVVLVSLDRRFCWSLRSLPGILWYQK
ncbi:hypothetical protein K438DRAFT_1787683 [Mycena galopus ATCC 62051]|nr:hypothetical protein K438DRAFT_1787683 [Mycena galopus ATCC 62051]